MKILLLSVLMFLASCSTTTELLVGDSTNREIGRVFKHYRGTREPMNATILRVVDTANVSFDECRGRRAWVQTEKGPISIVCARGGQVGDVISGYWVTGARGAHSDGFKYER